MYTRFEFVGDTEGSSVLVCSIGVIGMWLPLFGQSCGSCTILKIDTVSCCDM
jgi:hypothetical protein